jgi:hypothetical protein
MIIDEMGIVEAIEYLAQEESVDGLESDSSTGFKCRSFNRCFKPIYLESPVKPSRTPGGTAKRVP